MTKPARLSIYFIVSMFLLVSQLAFSSERSINEISKSVVQQVKVNLGEKIAFQSTYMNEQKEFYLRLPESYQKSKRHYPVIYLLDANNETLTYMDNLYFHSVAQIERLIKHGDIPESIIVGVPFTSKQWYSNVIANPKPFRDYLTNELATYINDNYRTSNNNMLIGQSYSAVFVINSLPKNSDIFNSFIAIEPVLASGELEKAIEHYRNTSVKGSDLQIIMGGAIMLHEAEELYNQIKGLTGKEIEVSLEVFPNESHGSVYYPALNSALIKYFADFRSPNRKQILSNNFDHQSLLTYFDKRADKYQVETTEKQFQSAVFDAIFYYLKEEKFEQAFALWPVWQSQYKMYNANRIISYFLRENNNKSAITLLEHLAKAMPNSVSTFDRLASLHQQSQQDEKAKYYRLKVQQILTEIFSGSVSPQQEASLNRYGYNLLQEQRHLEAITVFMRISQANPDSINAYDSLADAYEANKNYGQAIKALEKMIMIAQNKENFNLTSFQQKLQRLKGVRISD